MVAVSYMLRKGNNEKGWGKRVALQSINQGHTQQQVPNVATAPQGYSGQHAAALACLPRAATCNASDAARSQPSGNAPAFPTSRGGCVACSAASASSGGSRGKITLRVVSTTPRACSSRSWDAPTLRRVSPNNCLIVSKCVSFNPALQQQPNPKDSHSERCRLKI